jgi:hypothetical protein
VRTLSVTQLTSASESDLKRAVTESGAAPVPTLTLRWRGRANVQVLNGQLSIEIVPAVDGRMGLTCQYSLHGPFSWLLGRDAKERLRGNLQYLAALICHRAEGLRGARNDGRPLPSIKAEGLKDVSVRRLRPALDPHDESGGSAAAVLPDDDREKTLAI